MTGESGFEPSFLKSGSTLGCAGDWNVRDMLRFRDVKRKKGKKRNFMSFTERLRDDAKETWRAVVEHPFTGMIYSYRGMRASPHLSETSLSYTFSSSET